jgi:predicted NUDIX family NTP pyrophosphohydrolase
MPKQSAGLLMYRRVNADLEVFLVHPGGPFWTKKDNGAWSIPKGEYEEGEDAQDAARREFHEETGFKAEGVCIDLGVIKQAGGKTVTALAFEGNCDPQHLKSNLCHIEWPPRSKRLIEIPEVDRGAWFSIPEAKKRILKSQQPLLERLCRSLHQRGQRECGSE